MYSVILCALMPTMADASPMYVRAGAGCAGAAAASSYVVVSQSTGCAGSMTARSAPLRTAAANHRSRVASRQDARANRARVNVVRPAFVQTLDARPAAVAVYCKPKAKVYVARPRAVVNCPNGNCPLR